MFKRIQSARAGSDCTAPYSIVLEKEYTVEEFINAALHEYDNEWGYFGVFDGKSVFGNPECEYSNGSVLNTLPDDILRSKIVSVKASGGWSRMDYMFYLN